MFARVGRYLSTYYTVVEVPKLASDGYENAPTLVGMADVFVNNLGYVWNKKARAEFLNGMDRLAFTPKTDRPPEAG